MPWPPLAKTGVPLLHVCGSLDPWLEEPDPGGWKSDIGNLAGRLSSSSKKAKDIFLWRPVGHKASRGLHH